MSPPTAVTAPAPVGLPQGAAPPGAGSTSSPASTAGMFGTILDSARTAPAEGHQTGATPPGRSKALPAPVRTQRRQPQTPGTSNLLTAAVAFLTGQPAPGAAASPTTSGSSKPTPVARGTVAGQTGTTACATTAVAVAEHAASAEPSPVPADAGQSEAAGRRPAAAPAASTASVPSSERGSKPATASTSQPAVGAVGAEAVRARTTRGSLGAEPLATGGSPSSPAAPPSSQASAKAPAATAERPRAGVAAPGLAETLSPQAAAAPHEPTPGSRAPAEANASRPGEMPSLAGAASQGAGAHDPGNRQQSSSDRHLGTPWRAPASSPSASVRDSTGQVATAARSGLAQAPANVNGPQTAGLAKAGFGVARSSVTLQEAVDSVRATFIAANQAGVSSARITLSPAALGGIKIALSQTPDGLIARVIADHPEAVQTLAQSVDELRSSLTQSGLHVLSLEISSSGQQSASGFNRQQGYGTGAPNSHVSAPGPDEEQSQPATELTVRLPSGSLISVLA